MGTIYLKCPNCGKKLCVKSVPGIENFKVPCPACGVLTPFLQYEQFSMKRQDRDTELPLNLEVSRVRLVDNNTGRTYELPEGRNSVGRAHVTSTAEVQLVTTDMGMSRVHSTIQVIKTASGAMRCVISNANNKNATYINGEKLEGEDELYLQNGDIIKMSHSEFTVEMS